MSRTAQPEEEASDTRPVTDRVQPKDASLPTAPGRRTIVTPMRPKLPPLASLALPGALSSPATPASASQPRLRLPRPHRTNHRTDLLVGAIMGTTSTATRRTSRRRSTKRSGGGGRRVRRASCRLWRLRLRKRCVGSSSGSRPMASSIRLLTRRRRQVRHGQHCERTSAIRTRCSSIARRIISSHLQGAPDWSSLTTKKTKKRGTKFRHYHPPRSAAVPPPSLLHHQA